ncbi:hypothetical protein JMA_17950 [Jeotgalibacillus malaysiensis]|uniref:Nuclease SbcCD subunit C n=1 Tax=Jeotgalibacillus malaysiensis TaxID=1508404 RepID=A0A0B5AR27_9BACL|nr:SMC family ATPase [Jeotgalibacillus malaysiensis]AJD91112.1 hypothetical protein JMA_17950 [Jeotgalibacillus malaysiensis]
MRPKKLTMYAFGPYAGKEEINFDELGSRTMFVISGKTGAGKTTIFDAIAFALYGKTSGEERSAQDLRSDFADEDQLTAVDFIFSLKNNTYRINRSPIQSRRKTRGEGYTTVSAKAEMYEVINGEEKLIAATLSESDDQINKLLQLDFHQFKQILMIPQGEFRTLLTSDSTDKEKILQKLFHTESYRYFQDYLKTRAKQLRDEATGFQQERIRLYEAIDPLENTDLSQALNQEHRNDELIISLAKNLVATQKELFKKRSKDITNEKEKYTDILKKIENARYIDQSFIELSNTKDEINKLTNQHQDITLLKNKLQISRKADQLWPQYQELQAKETELSMREQHRIKTSEQLKRQERQLNEDKKAMADLKVEKENIKNDEAELNDLYKLNERLDQFLIKSRELNEFAESGKSEKLKLDDLKGKLSDNEQLKINLSDALSKRYEQQTRSADLTVELSQLNELIKIIKDLNQKSEMKEQLFNELKEKKVALSQVQKYLLEEQAKLKHALNEQSVQSAFELSSQLKDGEACPVCGSIHHPNPATRSGEVVDIDDFRKNIEKLQLDKVRTESSIGHLEDRISGVVSEIETLVQYQKNAPGYKESSSLTHYLQLFESQKKEQAVLLEQIKINDVSDSIKKAEQQSIDLKREIQLLEETVQQKRDQYVSLRSIITQLKEEIPDVYLDSGVLQARIKELEKKIRVHYEYSKHVEARFLQSDKEVSRLLDRLKQAEEEKKNIFEALNDSKNTFGQLLSESSFENAHELIQSKLNDGEQTELEHKISTHEKKLFSLEEYAAKLENELKHVSRPDLQKLQSEKEMIESAIKKLDDQLSDLSAYLKQHDQILLKIDQNQTAAGEIEKKYLLTGQLSEIANGQNELKLTFERFVLAYYLEDILIIANERLLKMTSGRYELHRKEDRSKGNKQGGLELLVMDHYTGQQRHVKTLSGGEAFKASLALALGLADVVQSYAGGVSLETMFIDEGFGTLDPESLDQAIESLMDIQSNGRLVGVISHVPELKERIDARLEVFSTKGGSSTRFLFETL